MHWSACCCQFRCDWEIGLSGNTTIKLSPDKSVAASSWESVAASSWESVAASSWELTNASVLTVVLGRKGFLPFSVAEWDASAGSSAWVFSPPRSSSFSHGTSEVRAHL